MTTEERITSRRPPLRRLAAALAIVAGGWLAVIVTLTFGSATGKSMAVIGSPAQTLAAIAQANGQILAASGYVTIARSDEAGFVARLYAAGARLVVDADQAGGGSGLPPASSLRGAKRRGNPASGQDGRTASLRSQ